MSIYKQYIGGAWVDASNGGTWDVVESGDRGGRATVPFGGAADCDRAIDAARARLRRLARATAYERGAILEQAAALIRARADALARITVRESGKPLAEARGEWAVAADLFEWFAEEGKRAYGYTIPSRVADQADAGAASSRSASSA